MSVSNVSSTSSQNTFKVSPSPTIDQALDQQALDTNIQEPINFPKTPLDDRSVSLSALPNITSTPTEKSPVLGQVLEQIDRFIDDPSAANPDEIATAADSLRTEILSKKDELSEPELTLLQKKLIDLTRTCNLHSNRLCMPKIEQTCITIDAIKSGQTNVAKGEKLGQGSINTVFTAQVAGKELVLKECIESQIQRINESDLPEISSGILKIGFRGRERCVEVIDKKTKYIIDQFNNPDREKEGFMLINNKLCTMTQKTGQIKITINDLKTLEEKEEYTLEDVKKYAKQRLFFAESEYTIKGNAKEGFIIEYTDNITKDLIATRRGDSYAIHEEGELQKDGTVKFPEKGIEKTLDDGSIVREKIKNGKSVYTPGTDTLTLPDKTEIRIEYHTLDYAKTGNKPAKIIKSVTKTFPNGEISSTAFPKPLDYAPENSIHLGNGIWVTKKIFSRTQQAIVDQIQRSTTTFCTQSSINKTLSAQNSIVGHLCMYEANRVATILQEALGLHVVATTSAALDEQGNAYIAMERVAGKDMMRQENQIFYDEESHRIVTQQPNGLFKPIEEKSEAQIIVQNSILQAFDCIIGQMDRHPENIMYDPETGYLIGIDGDLALPTPEARPDLANNNPSVLRQIDKKTSTSLAIDGKSPRNYCKPPISSVHMANKILQINPKETGKSLRENTLLSEEVINAIESRTEKLQASIREDAGIGPGELINEDNPNIWIYGGIKCIGPRKGANRTNSYGPQNYWPAGVDFGEFTKREIWRLLI